MLTRFKLLVSALAITLLITTIFLLLNHYSPGQIFMVMVQSTWGSSSGFILLLTKASLLILTGLAVVIPYRAGLFNIGGEGQMLTGGLLAALAGIYFPSIAWPLHCGLCLLVGVVTGGLWGGIAAGLKSHRGVHEVITTIMLNFIGLQIVNECALNYFNAGESTSHTQFLQQTSWLPLLVSSGTAELNCGIIIAILAAGFLGWGLYWTWPGFSLRATGINPKSSMYAGISVPRQHLLAMVLGGGCAGLAGAIQVCGMDHTFYARFTSSYGFDGIAVAFLAMNEPWTVIPSALLIATLRASDRALQLDMGLPKEMILIIEGIVIISMAVMTGRRKHE